MMRETVVPNRKSQGEVVRTECRFSDRYDTGHRLRHDAETKRESSRYCG